MQVLFCLLEPVMRNLTTNKRAQLLWLHTKPPKDSSQLVKYEQLYEKSEQQLMWRLNSLVLWSSATTAV